MLPCAHVRFAEFRDLVASTSAADFSSLDPLLTIHFDSYTSFQRQLNMAGLIGQLIALVKHTQGGPTEQGPIGYSAAYFPPAYRPPRSDNEAQKLYNHARVVAYYLDAMPIPGGKLPFGVGIDVSALPS